MAGITFTTTLSRVVIVDDGMYHGRGIVIRWVQRVTRRFGRDARRFAPVRTGRLKAGIRVGTPRNPLRKVVQGTISSHAPHTMYVLKGTQTPIMTDKLWAAGGIKHIEVETRVINGKLHNVPVKGQMLAVGRNPWPPVTPKTWVRGQRANNFLERAWVSTGFAYPDIARIRFPLKL